MKRFTAKCMLFLFGFTLLAGSAQAADVSLKVLEGVEMHAFASSSYNFNFNQPTSRAPNSATNVNRIFDADHNSFKFDAGELVFLKETPKIGDVGFRTDLSFGFGLPEVAQSTPDSTDTDSYQFDVQQGYVSYKAPIGSGLQLDFGKFITHVGAEVFEGHDGWNYNFSRSFMFGLAIPFTHTGLKAGYTINDMISVMGMVANGWDNTVDNNRGKTLGAQIAITPSDNVGILLNWVAGQEAAGNQALNAFSTTSNDTTNLFNAVLDVSLTDRTLAQLDLVYAKQANGAAGGRGDAEWWGISGILRHDCSKWFSINLRGEFFNDADGVRTASGTTLPTGQGQQLWEFTVTPEIRVNQNMIVRMEYRHDQSSRDETFFASGAGRTKNSQDTIALNALFYF